MNNNSPQTTNTNTNTTTDERKHLYFTVSNYAPDGKADSYRVVDLFHPNTRDWLAKHTWWAMHNDYTLDIQRATEDEVNEYIRNGERKLADKFNQAA